MLSVNNVTKKYGKNTACANISFELNPGTINVLLGPNGAGKSTLLKSIIGFLKYDGEITVNGFNNKSIEAKKILGYIPEIPALYPNLTVYEHMEFTARVYRMENYADRIEMLLDRFELSDKRKKFGDELSKGMQQKLNICCGLLPNPEIVLFDEPMIGLDPHAIRELKCILAELRDEGKTVLLSTHMIDSVDMLWDRALIIKKADLIGNFTNGSLAGTGETLEDAFIRLTEKQSDEPIYE